MHNLNSNDYEMKDYGTTYALTQVDIMRPHRSSSIRWTYTLMFQVERTEAGVDNKGSRASGQARAAVIDGKLPAEYPMIEIGEVIRTPYGYYRVEWRKEFGITNYDHLTLVELPRQLNQCATCGEVYETEKTCPCPSAGAGGPGKLRILKAAKLALQGGAE